MFLAPSLSWCLTCSKSWCRPSWRRLSEATWASTRRRGPPWETGTSISSESSWMQSGRTPSRKEWDARFKREGKNILRPCKQERRHQMFLFIRIFLSERNPKTVHIFTYIFYKFYVLYFVRAIVICALSDRQTISSLYSVHAYSLYTPLNWHTCQHT